MKVNKVGDFKLSLNPVELRDYIKTINNSFLLIGKRRNGHFKNEKSFLRLLEDQCILILQKKGDSLKRQDISFLRPFNSKGIEIKEIRKFIGKSLRRGVKVNQLLKKDYLKHNEISRSKKNSSRLLKIN